MKVSGLILALLIANLALPFSVWADAPKYRPADLLIEPVTGMTFVKVTGGCFKMGCGKWVWGSNCENDEKPVRDICLDSFLIGRHEVTQSEWRKVMKNNPSFAQTCGPDCPVEMVSFDDAQEFITRLNAISRSGYRFRLPTEAEWEYACRSGGRPEIFCGGAENRELAWYRVTSQGKSHPVGKKQPNGLGLFDMSGNVWEWCSDFYQIYQKTDKPNPQGPPEGQSRVIRGGSWGDYYSRFCRAAYRGHYLPYLKSKFIGFRLVLDLPAGESNNK